jgi:small subunit ribosomal protein S6
MAEKPKKYETLFVLHPDQAGKAKEYVERFKRVLETLGGQVTHVEEWGLRDLAYRIQKQGKGYYILMHFTALAAALNELERNLKLSEGVIRHITVRLEEQEAASPGKPEAAAAG